MAIPASESIEHSRYRTLELSNLVSVDKTANVGIIALTIIIEGIV